MKVIRFIWLSVLALCSLPALAQTPNQDPSTAVFRAFLNCDAQWFTTLSEHGAAIASFKPLKRFKANLTQLTVPNRLVEEGQTLALTPAFTMQGVVFNEFFDEINVMPVNAATTPAQTLYFWGFNTEAPINKTLPLVQRLINEPALTADGDTWARMALFDNNTWQPVADHAAYKGTPATKPERILIVQANEGGGTRVVCGLQGAPLPQAELQKLRPDIAP